MTTFQTEVLGPVILIVKNHGGCVKSLIGKYEIYRNLFSRFFDLAEMRLEDLPQEEKLTIWNESKDYCEVDRVKWCKAIIFYKTF